MSNHPIAADDSYGATVKRRPSVKAGIAMQGLWSVVCRDKDGNIKWTDDFSNLVTNEGLDHLLDVTLSGATQDTTWFVGLTDGTPTVAAGDTLASHAGWTEVTAYSGDRKAWTDGGVASQSVDNSASGAEFTINADSTTIGGAFLSGAETGTTGVLYAAGAFSAGNKSLDTSDTLTVTATFTAAAA